MYHERPFEKYDMRHEQLDLKVFVFIVNGWVRPCMPIVLFSEQDILGEIKPKQTRPAG